MLAFASELGPSDEDADRRGVGGAFVDTLLERVWGVPDREVDVRWVSSIWAPGGSFCSGVANTDDSRVDPLLDRACSLVAFRDLFNGFSTVASFETTTGTVRCTTSSFGRVRNRVAVALKG